MDADGNWGYIVPESEDVIAFGSGRTEEPGESLKTYQWKTVECNGNFVEGDRSWTADVMGSGAENKMSLFLAIKVPEPCKAIMDLYKGSACSLSVYFNDEEAYEDTASKEDDIRKVLQLVKGVNYIFLECWRNSAADGNDVSISFSPIVA